MSSVNPIRAMDPEALVPCPYDATHMISFLRWPRHIIKCRKNHPTHDLRMCPFNARHEVPAVELRHHIATCPDQVIIHQEILNERRRRGELEGTYIKGNTDVPPYDGQWSKVIASEDWDMDYCSDPVSVQPSSTAGTSGSIDRTGLTLSQRREHRTLLKSLDERNKKGESIDDIVAAINALKTGSSHSVGKTENGQCTSSQKPMRIMRLPREAPLVDNYRQMNGVNTYKEKSSQMTDVNRLNVIGRGTGIPNWNSEQVDKRYEILAKLAAGRGGPKPRTS